MAGHRPHLPAPSPAAGAGPRFWPMRQIVEAILYLDRAGCAWRYLPADFPPWQTVYGYFAAWRDDGTFRGCMTGCAPRSGQPPGGTPSPPPR